MAHFQALSRERVAELTARRGPGMIDLTEYKKWIEDAVRTANGWGEILLDPNENVRAIKRRTTIAGKELHRVVKWHRKSTAKQLVFQAVDPATIVRRPRRPRGG
jgi:hypothetical protein